MEPIPDEYDVNIAVTYHGVTVHISDRDTDRITHEQTDLSDIEEAIDYLTLAISEGEIAREIADLSGGA